MGESTALVERQVHRQATAAPVSEIAGTLQELLSRRLTAFIAGVGDGKTVSRWASGEVAEIRDVWMEQRLRTAYEITQLLLTYDASQTVKAWFIGLNPQLGDVSPAEALREGRLKDALSTAGREALPPPSLVRAHCNAPISLNRPFAGTRPRRRQASVPARPVISAGQGRIATRPLLPESLTPTHLDASNPSGAVMGWME